MNLLAVSSPALALRVRSCFQVWRPPTRGPDSTLKRQGEEKLPTWARRESNSGKHTAMTLAVDLSYALEQHSHALAVATFFCKGTAGHCSQVTGAQAVLSSLGQHLSGSNIISLSGTSKWQHVVHSPAAQPSLSSCGPA